MKQSVKKRIAKEVLIIFGFIFFLPLFYGSFYLKNLYFSNSAENIKEEYENLNPYNSKYGNLLEERFKYAKGYEDDYQGIWKIEKEDFKNIEDIIQQRLFENKDCDSTLIYSKQTDSVYWIRYDIGGINLPSRNVLKAKENITRLRCLGTAVPFAFPKEKEVQILKVQSNYIKLKKEFRDQSEQVTPFKKMTPYLIWWLIILSSIAYPLRGVYFLLKWAIKTVKS